MEVQGAGSSADSITITPRDLPNKPRDNLNKSYTCRHFDQHYKCRKKDECWYARNFATLVPCSVRDDYKRFYCRYDFSCKERKWCTRLHTLDSIKPIKELGEKILGLYSNASGNLIRAFWRKAPNQKKKHIIAHAPTPKITVPPAPKAEAKVEKKQAHVDVGEKVERPLSQEFHCADGDEEEKDEWPDFRNKEEVKADLRAGYVPATESRPLIPVKTTESRLKKYLEGTPRERELAEGAARWRQRFPGRKDSSIF